ncbi:Beta-1,4-glucuronyltransferase 1 [Apodemus speciosus]|uniref:Beta-1,4-glucuronyltransferase 1 n=1 Tax=Apodemus speciosus TaxID=105296 RepID=A0ABQ0FRZ9_APOSI
MSYAIRCAFYQLLLAALMLVAMAAAALPIAALRTARPGGAGTVFRVLPAVPSIRRPGKVSTPRRTGLRRRSGCQRRLSRL